MVSAIRWSALGSVIAGVLVSACGRPAAPKPAVDVRTPNPDIGVDTLEARRKAQNDTAGQIGAFHDFHFADRLKDSGITFVHHIVEDAGVHYKAVHYDHGSGIAVADVDGDGLYDIYFVNQVGGNELWKNLGHGRFAPITKDAGVALPGRISVGASFADIDNDGDQDLFVTTVRGGNALFENDGHGHFKDISQDAGIALAAHSSGAVFFDYDGDGLLDLLVCNVGRYTSDEIGGDGAHVGLADAFLGHLHPDRFEYPVLYKNLGHNRFKDVTADAGLRPAGWGGDAAVADLNGDGRPDLFVLNMQGHGHYYENAGGRTFVDKTTEYFPKTPWGSMGITFFDFDNDGRPDLFITDMHSDMFETLPPDREKQKAAVHPPDQVLGGPADRFIFGNALFHNLGGGRFEEISDRAGVETYWPWGPSVGDVNADGWDDIFIASSMNYPHRYGINSMLLNDRGKRFRDAEFVLGIEPRSGGRTHTPWFELDCLQKDLGNDLCRGQSGKITIMAPLGSRAAAIFDLDRDGDLDIVTNDFNSAPQVLVSDLAQRWPIHWLEVSLVGTASNRNGLGESATVDRVEVDWPSGRKQVETSQLGVNRTLQIVEPK